MTRTTTLGRLLAGATITAAIVVAAGPAASAAAGNATCSNIFGEVHGFHIVGDYVDGDGHSSLEWPPAGQVDAAGGAAVKGGPGVKHHQPYAPGASFCVGNANSPGIHL